MKQLSLQANWIHSSDVERWLRKMAMGSTLNVCCGTSLIGDVRGDTSTETTRTEAGDVFNLRFPPLSFDTVICDPPFEYYNRFKWVWKLADIARKRFLISTSKNIIRLNPRVWHKELYAFEGGDQRRGTGTMFLRLYYCFDRANEYLGSSAKENA